MKNNKKVYVVTFGDDYERLCFAVFGNKEKAQNCQEEMNKEDPKNNPLQHYAEIEQFEIQ